MIHDLPQAAMRSPEDRPPLVPGTAASEVPRLRYTPLGMTGFLTSGPLSQVGGRSSCQMQEETKASGRSADLGGFLSQDFLHPAFIPPRTNARPLKAPHISPTPHSMKHGQPPRTLMNPRKLAALTLLALASLSSPLRADLYPVWVDEYDPGKNYPQNAAAVAVDARGNVITTGAAFDASGTYPRYYTAKLDALDGSRIWSVTFGTGTTRAKPNDVVIDSEGNVIVTGNVNDDVYTVKYSGLDGTEIWHVQYDGPNGGLDEGIKLAVAANDDVVMTARSVGSGSSTDIYTAKYAKGNGNLSWSDRYTTAGTRTDVPTDLVVDGSDNIVVVGSAETASGFFSFYVRKLNSGGAFQWDKVVNSGGEAGATGVAADSSGNVFATGVYADASRYRGYYTIKYASNGTPASGWPRMKAPLAQEFVGGATDIAIAPDGNPIVTGWLKNGAERIYTEKYASVGAGILGSFTDEGNAAGDSRAHRLIVDGSGNAIIVGDSDTAVSNADIYVAKYNAALTTRVFDLSFPGSKGTDDSGVAIGGDGNGGFAFSGTAFQSLLPDGTGVGYNRIITVKVNRFIAEKGDELPDDPEVPVDALFATGNAPAVSDTGSVAALIGATSGKTKLTAILTQGTAGGSAIPAVQKGTAPGITGAKFSSFSDPVVAPNGRYAFAAKVTGVPGSQASGVWTNLSGSLQLALQQGKPVPSLTENLSSVMSLSLRDTQLLALVKVAAPGKSNVALISLNAANAGTKLLRTGDAVTVNAKATTIKSLTVLSPALISPGDGRWQGNTNTVVLATLADKRSVIYRITTAGVATPKLFTEGDAAAASGVTGATWKTFGKPAVATSGGRFATLGTLDGATKTNDTMLFYSANGTTFSAFAKEGSAPNAASLSALTYTAFSDPLVNSNGDLAFIATLKGTGVKPANSKALLFGAFGNTYEKVARLGDLATDGAGTTDTAVWNSFVSFALAGGANGGPIFVAKLSGAGVNGKNNLGVWAVGSDGLVRRLLRTGDAFGSRTVASFNLLKAVPTAFTAARSFNANSAVAVQITFTDKSQALLKIGIP